MMLFRVLVCVVFLFLGSSVALALEPDQVFAKVSKSIVVVTADDYGSDGMSQGSGVIIGPGEIVTNCHVVENAKTINVERGEFRSTAQLRFSDPDRDICQISANDIDGFENAVSKIIAVTELRVGQKAYAIGAPQGLNLTLSDGLVSSIRDTDWGLLIQTTAPVSPGSSGGGLFSSDGDLIGITTFVFKRGQNLNFAVPANWITELSDRTIDRIERERLRLAAVHRRVAMEKRRREEERLRLEAEQRRLEEEQVKARAEAEKLKLEEEQKQRIAEQERLERERERQEVMEQRRLEQALALFEEFRDEDLAIESEQLRQEEWEITFPEEAERVRQEKAESRQVERRRQIEAELKIQEQARAAAPAEEQQLVDDFRMRIQAKIRSRIIIPPNLSGNPNAIYQVVLLPGGDVLSATLKKSSGSGAYDVEIRRAIMAAQPLPVLGDPDLFHEYFRVLNLSFRPEAKQPPPVQVAPSVTPAPAQSVQLNVAPVIAMPAPRSPLPVVQPAELEAYRQSVSNEVMKHLSYPRFAVMRKWQGTTIVEMKLSADGGVIQVVVAESSGKKVLDDAALNMARSSLPLPKPPQGVRTVTVPVVFRLWVGIEQQQLVDDFKARINAKVRSRIVMPSNITGNPEVLYEVVLLPGGDVLSASMKKSSGVRAYDRAVRSAVMAAQPLPVPSEPKLFQDHFRRFNISFRPQK